MAVATLALACGTLVSPSEDASGKVRLGDLSVEIPAGWHVTEWPSQFHLGFLSTYRLADVCKRDDADCVTAQRVPRGEALVSIAHGSCRCTVFEFLGDPEWSEVVDGLPAQRREQEPPPGPDRRYVSWAVISPRDLGSIAQLEATIPNPDLGAHEAAFDGIARSLVFEARRPALPAAQDAERVLGAAIERIVNQRHKDGREQFGTDYYGCFPPRVGERLGVVHGGPGGAIGREVDVACRVSVERVEELAVWRVVLTAREHEGPPEASYSEAIYVGADGGEVGWENLTAPEAGFR